MFFKVFLIYKKNRDVISIILKLVLGWAGTSLMHLPLERITPWREG
jgi:hypothetical protein